MYIKVRPKICNILPNIWETFPKTSQTSRHFHFIPPYTPYSRQNLQIAGSILFFLPKQTFIRVETPRQPEISTLFYKPVTTCTGCMSWFKFQLVHYDDCVYDQPNVIGWKLTSIIFYTHLKVALLCRFAQAIRLQRKKRCENRRSASCNATAWRQCPWSPCPASSQCYSSGNRWTDLYNSLL